MTIGEVIAAIEANYPVVGLDTVDTIKFGNADSEVTGIVTTCCATVEVIRKAAVIRLDSGILYSRCCIFRKE